ncbi:hypothetical protein OG897_40610 [Streptomyces sp. NBC_00237]|uniref:hypothetical protein n=1 Tax=Streptomyces sp. NBC_00237 TaxID=2975687 RepID=UPI00225C10B0|nr:hypothetical protein [Streptomyces sp. NBC_00237]MCX5207687.1 hypothetical protein [Streptomyces sp. NBC_00237]
MMTLADLPEAVDAPEDLTGPLSEVEAERWETCKRGLRQFRDAWHVAALSVDIALRGKLWRAEYDTAAEFLAAEAKMSTSNAYRQIAGAGIAAILAGQTTFELESNEVSRMRDTTVGSTPEAPAVTSEAADAPPPMIISQRAAEALGPVRETFDQETAAAVYRAVAEVQGTDTVSGKVIKGIVLQLPREVDRDALLDHARKLAQPQEEPPAPAPARDSDPVKAFREYVVTVRRFAQAVDGMAAAHAAAAQADPEATRKMVDTMGRHMKTATKHFPDV